MNLRVILSPESYDCTLATILSVFDTVAVNFSDFYENCKSKIIILDNVVKLWLIRELTLRQKSDRISNQIASN